ncbi:hypothetical protein PRIPAC_87483 [Pristionchus pacificus]|nr:hypothetical protein PRIPAC_87483 [Pristionchus pacificus]
MTDLNECDRIVRMHETWTEKPPEGWQYNVDLATLKTVEQNKFVSKMRETMTHRETFLYIRMELCKYSLRDWIDENTTVESRNLPRMKMWFHQVVTAVAFLQQKNFIHRDLKPCNILFFEDDNVKLCDLGIVTLRSKGGGPTAIYRTSIGTLLYMSPEQRSAAPKYGSKTDVFSLGLILAELSVVMTNDERNKILTRTQHTPHFFENGFQRHFKEKLPSQLPVLCQYCKASNRMKISTPANKGMPCRPKLILYLL